MINTDKILKNSLLKRFWLRNLWGNSPKQQFIINKYLILICVISNFNFKSYKTQILIWWDGFPLVNTIFDCALDTSFKIGLGVFSKPALNKIGPVNIYRFMFAIEYLNVNLIPEYIRYIFSFDIACLSSVLCKLNWIVYVHR